MTRKIQFTELIRKTNFTLQQHENMRGRGGGNKYYRVMFHIFEGNIDIFPVPEAIHVINANSKKERNNSKIAI